MEVSMGKDSLFMKKLALQGYSLIELMIALLLGSILLLGVMQVMIGSSTLGTTTSNLLANQDTAKSTLDLLGGEARRAGYNGCLKADNGLLDIAIAGYNDKDRYALMPVIDSEGRIGIEFRYGIDEKVGSNQGDLLANKDCLNKPLHFRNMIYQNCVKTSGEQGICVKGKSSKNAGNDLVDDIIEDVELKQIVFSYFDQSFNNYKIITFDKDHQNVSDDTLKKLQSAEKVTFFVKALGRATGANKKSMTKVERDYSASYKLRNL